MPYVPPRGNAVGLDLQGSALPPPAGSVNLEFDGTYTGGIRAVGGIVLPFNQVGFIVQNQRKNLYLAGIPPPLLSPYSNIERAVQKVLPPGIQPPPAPAQNLSYSQMLSARGIEAPENPYQIARIRSMGAYNAPPASSVILDFLTTPYPAPPASSVIIEFGSEAFTRVLGAGVGDTSAFGLHAVNKTAGINPPSLGDTSRFGVVDVSNNVKRVYPTGIASPTPATNNQLNHLATAGDVQNFMMLLF